MRRVASSNVVVRKRPDAWTEGGREWQGMDNFLAWSAADGRKEGKERGRGPAGGSNDGRAD